MHGLDSNEAHWAQVPQPAAFDPEPWLMPRAGADFDDENIGLLTTPPPNVDDVSTSAAARFEDSSDG